MIEFLKPYFNGQALTFEELQNALSQSNAKIINLSDGGYVSQSKYDDDIRSRDQSISTLNGTITERDNTIASLTAARENDKKTYEQALQKERNERACFEYAAVKPFNSIAARNWFVDSMMKQNLKLKDGKLEGADEYYESYKASNEDSFLQGTPGPVVDRRKNPKQEPPMTLEEKMKLIKQQKG